MHGSIALGVGVHLANVSRVFCWMTCVRHASLRESVMGAQEMITLPRGDNLFVV